MNTLLSKRERSKSKSKSKSESKSSSNISSKSTSLSMSRSKSIEAHFVVDKLHERYNEIVYIPLTKLIYDEGMIRAINDFCPGVLQNLDRNLEKGKGGFNLYKWARVERAVTDRVPLDPVELKELPNGYYEVLDGRHRVSVSFCKNMKTVPAFVRKTFKPTTIAWKTS